MCLLLCAKTHFEVLSIFCTILTFSRDLMIVAIFPTAFFLSAQHTHNMEEQEKFRRNRSSQNTNRYSRPIKVELGIRHFWETTWAKGSCYCETPSPWKELRHLNVEDWSAVSLAIAAPRPFDEVRGAISPEKHVLVFESDSPWLHCFWDQLHLTRTRQQAGSWPESTTWALFQRYWNFLEVLHPPGRNICTLSV